MAEGWRCSHNLGVPILARHLDHLLHFVLGEVRGFGCRRLGRRGFSCKLVSCSSACLSMPCCFSTRSKGLLASAQPKSTVKTTIRASRLRCILPLLFTLLHREYKFSGQENSRPSYSPDLVEGVFSEVPIAPIQHYRASSTSFSVLRSLLSPRSAARF